MRFIKLALIIIIILTSLLLLLISIWATWEHNRDPLAALDIAAGQVTVLQDSTFSLDITPEPRNYRRVILSTERLGEIEAFISGPVEIPPTGLPLIVVLGGLEIGAENFQLIPNPGNNIFIIYRYPYSPHYWYEGTAVTQIPLIRRSVLRVPAQVAALIEWAAQQNWVDSERISVTGYSFGALFLPALYHLTECRNLTEYRNLADCGDLQLQQGVMAYAGADIYDLLKTNLSKLTPPLRSLFAWLAATAIHPIEPALHLPHLNNEFLIINGTADHQISEYSWSKLHQLTPDPKTIIILDEGHMHPKKPELTLKLVDISRNWLLEKGAINP